jgi:hypothetical protein
MSLEELGCCGAFCRTCPMLREKLCRGCQLGYGSGKRDLAKARCAVKVCCLKRNHSSCAECPEYSSCPTIQGFFKKRGYKYGKYRESLEFIRARGYEEFFRITDRWTRQYGKL